MITDVWPVSFSSHDRSVIVRSEIEEQANDLAEGVRRLAEHTQKLRETLESFKPLVSTTGLDLSVPTLRNLGRVLGDGNAPEPIDARGAPLEVFREVLGVDIYMADAISRCVGYHGDHGQIAEIAGMTPELMEKIRTAFVFRDPRHPSLRKTVPAGETVEKDNAAGHSESKT